LATCRRKLATAENRKSAWQLKYFAADCKFIEYCPPGKSGNGHTLTLPGALAFGNPGLPPLRSIAGANHMSDVSVHHRTASRPLPPPSPFPPLRSPKSLDRLRERIRLLALRLPMGIGSRLSLV
jgi:hypothetical protein